MAFGILYPLTATGTALPVADATDATDGHGYARADRRPAAAYGADGVTPPPPKNSRKQNSAL
jgi:hypothetical protein